MKSTVEQFHMHIKPQFRTISENAAARVEEGIFRAIEESLARQLADKGYAEETLPWGKYTVENMKSGNGGNFNIALKFSEDFIAALDDTKKAVYQDNFSDLYESLFTDFVTFGRFFAPDMDDAKKMANEQSKGVRMTDFQIEYFPNSYGDMLLKAAQQHKSVGEIYRIPLCDTVDHGVIEIEFTEGGAVPKFEASPAFKQRMKNDAASDE